MHACLRYYMLLHLVHALECASSVHVQFFTLFRSWNNEVTLAASSFMTWLQLFLSSYSPVGDPEQIVESKRYLNSMMIGLANDYYAWDPPARAV
jgi:hypothetical protein